MDSLLSFQTPSHPPPGINTSTSASSTNLPTLLVPKAEPIDDFVASQESQWVHQEQIAIGEDPELDLFSEYNRVSELWHLAFGTSFLQQLGAVQDAAALLSDPITPFGDALLAGSGPNRHFDPFVAAPVPMSDVVNAVASNVRGELKVENLDGVVSDPDSQAIVPVPAQQPDSSAVTVVRRAKSRRKELVRVMGLGGKDHAHYREIVRKMRLIFDSLRVLTSIEEEKRVAAVAAAAAARQSERLGMAATEAERQVRVATEMERPERVAMETEGLKRIAREMQMPEMVAMETEGLKRIAREMQMPEMVAMETERLERIITEMEMPERVTMEMERPERIATEMEMPERVAMETERPERISTPTEMEMLEKRKRDATEMGRPEKAGSEPEKPPVRRERRNMRIRGDLRAAALMREQGLWLHREKRIVGAIPGIKIGDMFFFRMELCVVGLHGQIQAGIDYLAASMSPNGEPIATSVIVSGGYEDDKDDGEVIMYTGHGGQGKNSSKQVAHQKLVGGNLALERSKQYGIEVRVIRGMRYEGTSAGYGKVYVYDGLYRIEDSWFEVGKSGFGVYKYKLCRIGGQAKMGSALLKEAREIRKRGIDYKPVYCLSTDISNMQENVPVRLFNDIDDNQAPLGYEYLTKTNFPQFVFHQSGKATGCDCVDGCADGCFCCMKNGGEFPYNQQGILVRGKPLIFECGPFCSCPPNCRNRVTQKGMKHRMEVFRSTQTCWGVRSLEIIHAGSFICEYTGVVLTREQAQILTMSGDLPIYPNRFSPRWTEWGDLSQVYTDYMRPSYPSIPPLDFSLDVSTMRNVACYMSHSSSPNVFVQFVLYDHNNLMFPHLMLFAMENIPPMRELSIDYGVADEFTGKLSICHE